MIISHSNEAIFVKTRKTASTSVEIALSEFCGPRDIITEEPDEDEQLRATVADIGPQHMRIALSALDLRGWARLARRRERPHYAAHMPAKRIRSLVGRVRWQTYRTFTIERNPWDRSLSLYWWMTRNERTRPSLTDFLRSVSTRRPHNLSNWSLYTDRADIIVDTVIPYESLEDGLHKMWAELGVQPMRPLQAAKSRVRLDRRHYSEVMSATDRDIVAAACSCEIEAFEYEF